MISFLLKTIVLKARMILKMIKMNDVIAFIDKAIEKNIDIRVDTYCLGLCDEISVCINPCSEHSIRFEADFKNNRFKLFYSPYGQLQLEVSDLDLAEFKVKALKTKKYSEYRIEENFKNYFNDLWS